MAKKNWIAGAIKHPGALTRQAEAVDMSPMEFAREHAGDKGKTGQRARLAMTLRGFHRKGSAKQQGRALRSRD